MIRVMAGKDTRTLRRSIVALAIYNCLIYLPLLMICICARSIFPALEHSDEVMPQMALWATRDLPAGSLVSGLILAAPLGAVMSTVSTYLVVIASGLVRDVYQHFLRPTASEAEVRRAAHVVMIVLGLVAVAASISSGALSASADRLQRRGLRCHFLRAGLDAGLLVPGDCRRHRRRHAGRRRHDSRPVHRWTGARSAMAGSSRSISRPASLVLSRWLSSDDLRLGGFARRGRSWSASSRSRRRRPSWPSCFCRRQGNAPPLVPAFRPRDSEVR